MQMSWRNMQIRRLLLFFSPFSSLRSNYRKWLRALLFALCPPGLLPSPPHHTSSVVIPNAILPVPYSPLCFSKFTPLAVTGFQLQLLLVSLRSEKSTPPEASYQNLLQQGGRLKLSGMTCGWDGAGGEWCLGVNVRLICGTFE